MIKNIFWNAEQARLRAGWRITFHLLLLVAIVLLFNFILIGAGLLANPSAVGSDPEAMTKVVNDWIGANPVLIILATASFGVSVLVSTLLSGKWFDHRPFSGFGLTLNSRWWRDFAFGAMLGALLMSLIFAVENASGWVSITGTLVTDRPDRSFVAGFLSQIVAFGFVGFYEELLSRGYQLTNLAEGMNQRKIGRTPAVIIAWLISSMVFGFLHLGNQNASLVSTFNIFLAGLFLALPYILTGSLGASIGIHFTWNLFQGNVFGFPVSGGAFPTSVIAIRQGGPELWTGGAFGPEAGLLGIAAILLGSALVLGWVRWQYGKIALVATLGEYPKRGEAISNEA